MADPTPNEAVIETRGLTRYYGTQRVVDHLDLRVPKGCIYALLGRNGAGKTTAVRLLLGLLQPDHGEATIFGEPSSALPPRTLARLSYVPENAPFYRWMTVAGAVSFCRSFYDRWNGALVEQILDHFELPRRRQVARLSNGQRVQLALALAVAPEPELLILDDPTLGLDAVVRRDFLESMVQIVQSADRTILFSSHILGDVERVADRVGIMVQGRLMVDCPTERFRTALRRVVLTFDERPPAVPEWPRLVNGWAVDRQLDLVVMDFDDQHQALAEALRPRSLQVMELSLEDAFVNYTRGRRRSLPVFARLGETANERTAS